MIIERYELKDSKHNKYWEIIYSPESTTTATHWGRISTNGQVNIRHLSALDRGRLVNSKKAKGYELVYVRAIETIEFSKSNILSVCLQEYKDWQISELVKDPDKILNQPKIVKSVSAQNYIVTLWYSYKTKYYYEIWRGVSGDSLLCCFHRDNPDARQWTRYHDSKIEEQLEYLADAGYIKSDAEHQTTAKTEQEVKNTKLTWALSKFPVIYPNQKQPKEEKRPKNSSADFLAMILSRDD